MARTPSTDPAFRRKETDPRRMTSESIAVHLQAFQSAGGRIEILGTTQVLTKISAAAAVPPRQTGRK